MEKWMSEFTLKIDDDLPGRWKQPWFIGWKESSSDSHIFKAQSDLARAAPSVTTPPFLGAA
jgi:hypothetical protein